jgi:tetratricopeptide (TPR) repeat protein
VRTIILGSWLGACLALAAAPALADPTPDAKDPKQLYDEGLRHYNLAEYGQAIDAWKQAYLLSKKPVLLFNIGQAFRLSGDCAQAMTFYDSYTREEPAPKNQDELDQAVAQCKDKLAVAGHAAPVPDKPPVPPPTHVTPEPATPVATVTAQPRPQPPTDLRRIGLITTLSGVALGGAALYFALDGRSQQNTVADITIWTPALDSTQSRGHRDNVLAWGLGIAGGAAVITGVVLWLTGAPAAETGPNVAIAPGGARIGWTFAF